MRARHFRERGKARFSPPCRTESSPMRLISRRFWYAGPSSADVEIGDPPAAPAFSTPVSTLVPTPVRQLPAVPPTAAWKEKANDPSYQRDVPRANGADHPADDIDRDGPARQHFRTGGGG